MDSMQLHYSHSNAVLFACGSKEFLIQLCHIFARSAKI